MSAAPLPFGASEIFTNCSLSLLNDIFENDSLQQEKQNDTLENSTLLDSDNMLICNSQLPQPNEKCTHSNIMKKKTILIYSQTVF